MPRAPGATIRPILLFQQPIQARRTGAAVPFVPIADLMPCGIPGQSVRISCGNPWRDKRLSEPVESLCMARVMLCLR